MGDPISATRLRQDIYRVLDSILETGEPVEVLRGGRRLLIVAGESRPSPLDRAFRNALACTPDEIEATRFEWDPEPL